MGKLKADQIKFIAEHYQDIDKIYRSQIKFCFDSKSNGAKAFNMLLEAYRSDIDAYHYGTDKRDFRFEYKSKDVRDGVYNDIIDAITEYHNVFGYDTSGYGNIFDTGDPENTDQDNGTNPGTTRKTVDWVTYLVIGAALVAIVLLLWPRKK